MKEEKLGVIRGAASRSKMYWEIAKLLLRSSAGVGKPKQKSGIATDDSQIRH
jgi:hypothetical protein